MAVPEETTTIATNPTADQMMIPDYNMWPSQSSIGQQQQSDNNVAFDNAAHQYGDADTAYLQAILANCQQEFIPQTNEPWGADVLGDMVNAAIDFDWEGWNSIGMGDNLT